MVCADVKVRGAVRDDRVAPVGKLDVAGLGEQDVLGLDVAVGDAQGVGVPQGGDELGGDLAVLQADERGLVGVALALRELQEVEEVAALAVLEHHDVVRLVLEEAEQRAHVRVRPEPLHDAQLVAHALRGVALLADHLERHVLLPPRAVRLVHSTERPGLDQLQVPVHAAGVCAACRRSRNSPARPTSPLYTPTYACLRPRLARPLS